MATHLTTHRPRSWIEGLKSFVCGGFAAVFGSRKSVADEPSRPITTDEIVDLSSEDSFPASDPPSYTGSSIT